MAMLNSQMVIIENCELPKNREHQEMPAQSGMGIHSGIVSLTRLHLRR